MSWEEEEVINVYGQRNPFDFLSSPQGEALSRLQRLEAMQQNQSPYLQTKRNIENFVELGKALRGNA